VVNVVLKSGTNQFHGSFSNYYRDEKLNANTFDANRSGIAKAGLEPAADAVPVSTGIVACGRAGDTQLVAAGHGVQVRARDGMWRATRAAAPSMTVTSPDCELST
jgi:hypothetical protein